MKAIPCNPQEGNGNPFQHYCREKSHRQKSLAGYRPGLDAGSQRVVHDWATEQMMQSLNILTPDFLFLEPSMQRVCSRSAVSIALQSHGLQPTRLLCPWNFPLKNTGVGCHILLQGIFLTLGSNLCLCITWVGRQILYYCGSSKKKK